MLMTTHHGRCADVDRLLGAVVLVIPEITGHNLISPAVADKVNNDTLYNK